MEIPTGCSGFGCIITAKTYCVIITTDKIEHLQTFEISNKSTLAIISNLRLMLWYQHLVGVITWIEH